MKTVETVMLQTLLSAKQLVNDTHTYDFTGKSIPASEFITQIIMTHPAKDNILAVLTDTFDFNKKFGQVAMHNYKENQVCEFVELNPLEVYNKQIVIKVIKDKTGWYANESNAMSALKNDNYTPQSNVSKIHQFFVIGRYEYTDTISIQQWEESCETVKVKYLLGILILIVS